MASIKNKPKACEDLGKLTKEELILQVQRLTAHNMQLKGIISKTLENKQSSIGDTNKKKMDFTKVRKRHIFLKILYLGWDYQGYATQDYTNKTIEWELFQALRKSCLIEERTTSNYHRCGRTDKGVSAFGQVISLDVRSNIHRNQRPENEAVAPSTVDKGGVEVGSEKCTQVLQPYEEETQGELDYCKILNRLLPPTIRAIGWSPVRSDASARFNCKCRTYKYFFPRGNLNIENMAKAAEHLIGVHDFRNLCKMDVGNGVINYMRRILSVSIKVISGDQLFRSSDGSCSSKHFGNGSCHRCRVEEGDCDKGKFGSSPEAPLQGEHRESECTVMGGGSSQDCGNSSVCSDENSVVRENTVQCSVSEKFSQRKHSNCSMYDMCELTVVGQAFLWHQIRCIMTVLFLVGQGKEEPSVVEHLLDVDNVPRKPQYNMACEIPLNLFASDFESELNWVYDRECIYFIIKDLQKEWTLLSVRASMVRQMIKELGSEDADKWDGSELTDCLISGIRHRTYVPLLKRRTCESLEDRIEHFVKKKRLNLEADVPEVTDTSCD
ncbi:tRNA pseudouridine(38/39) synthase [Hetaerina americana]|uniref:tRNA pseudouridine(38/39) synthase n=1 Tax=Hetaerina americana TaxID=62018 RepID=UPI003A7F4410